jgi:sporulation protein YlmC with PRC-barrel domain
MRLDLGSPVIAADGEYGEVADVVIDPTKRRVTHLVVQPQHRHDLARLIPIERVRPVAEDQPGIRLDETIEEINHLEPLQRSAYLRIGETPVEDPEWEVGIENMLALPYYESLTPGGGMGTTMPAMAYDDHMTEIYDRVPKDTIEIRRASAVISSDDHSLGHVDGFVVGSDESITHLVLEHGHLWGKRDLTIPIGAVASIENDVVNLSLTKDQVGDLKSVPVRRY